ncbi:putative disease resistance protein At4g19050 [Magnolia sinica]|uniref:putative disease resistance protein At4g19050 n=1 Tax=Magnolia sinica TaxID=86752 RepID=UPI00265B00CF|nr:putative disease resistance protein At4g19050 [Magnolia sinica]
MAGRGGNGAAAAKGGLESFPAEIKRAGEKLLHCFTNPMAGVISVWGVGKWGIAEYASRKSNDSHLFHQQILVKLLGGDFSFGKAQKEILRQLGMTTSMEGSDDDEETDTQVATEIYNSLIRQKFLLVLGDVEISDINFELLGDPNLRRLLRNDSKIVLVGSKYVRSDMAIKLDGLSMDMLLKEAASIALSPSIKGRFTPNTLLDCFLYMLLFRGSSVKVDMLRWYWRGEGFIITEEVEEEDLTMFDKVEDLLTEFQVRSLVERDGDSHVTVQNSVAGTAKALVKWNKRSNSTHGRFWIEEGSLPKENDKLKDIQRMVVWDIREISTLPLKCPKLSTLFLVGESVFRISDNFFEQVKELRVLHLESIANESLPKLTLICLQNLRVLKLIDCPHLQTLLPSFRFFHKLEFLQISFEAFNSSLSIPDDVFQHMTNIRYLHLEGMQITSLPSSISKLHNLRHLLFINCNSLISIPDEFFAKLRQLRILDLHGNDKLESLPSSLSILVNLRKLILYNCFSLKMGLPSHLQKLCALEVLDLHGCRSVQDIGDITSSLLPNLRKLSISKIEAVQRLSLKGFKSLEYVSMHGLTSLQVLDLSATNLKTLPQGMSNARYLRCLDMLHMNQMREIHWADISTELEELNFSQCSTWNSSNDVEQTGERGGAHIRVSNSKLLQSFSPSLTLWNSKCFSRFHIYISPCQEDKQGTPKSIHLQRRLFVYKDIDCPIQTHNLPHLGSHFDRCLEIRGGHRSPNGMHGVLSRVELLTLFDNAFVQRLSDLGDVDKIKEMKECWVERCERMEMFFEGENASSDCLSRLEKIWMSNLARLRSVCEGTYGSRSFALLRHIHLDYCLRLVTVFSSTVFLQSLETLEIKCCSKLEAVFEGDAAAAGSLQQLHTVCLWELPRLKNICHGTQLSALNKLKVRGCGMLKKLPLRAGDRTAAATSASDDRVAVEGESEWWDRLKWEDEKIQHIINFKDPRPLRRRR